MAKPSKAPKAPKFWYAKTLFFYLKYLIYTERFCDTFTKSMDQILAPVSANETQFKYYGHDLTLGSALDPTATLTINGIPRVPTLRKIGSLTSAQVLTLATANEPMVAGVPGFAIVIDYVYLEYIFVTTPYTVAGVGNFQVINGAHQMVSSCAVAGFLDQGQNMIMRMNGTSNGSGTYFTAASYNGATLFLDLSGVTNPTLGDGTIQYTVQYQLIPIV